MKVIGLTGGIASGKSTVAKWFIESGFDVIDADFVYKELSKPKQVLYNKLISEFSSVILREDDSINWQLFSKMIFSDEAKRKRLNEITHPIIKSEIISRINAFKENGAPIVIIVVPLLFESDFHQLCQETVCVYTSLSIELKRLMERDHISKEDAMRKIKSQMSLDRKKKLATYVIDNDHDLSETKKQVQALIAKWKE